MSAQSSVLNSIREIPTGNHLKAEHAIQLVDRTKPPSINNDAENGSEGTATPTAEPETPLYKRLTNQSFTPLALQNSVRQQINKQKYARYGRDRYQDDSEATEARAEDGGVQAIGEPASATPASYLERSRAKAKSMLKRKRTLGREETQDTVIDILYENQRGSFFFGVPRYSSASLLPSDPRPWLNADFRTSPSDIRNAQPPDPSWQWAWKSWYVDMSRDVDEEGWEYSFLFRKEFSWHGNHPWFHSFVRRRRWLRMRRRKPDKHLTKEKGHELAADYFTIHPKTLKPSSDAILSASESQAKRKEMLEDVEPEKVDIADIASLMRILRRAKVDRQKLVAVRKFVDTSGDELYYLSERMSEIMSLFVYQSSRRQLLAELTSHHEDAHTSRETLAHHDHEDEDVQKEHDARARHTENLHKAVQAADAQVKKLEYWSDIKDMAEHDEFLHSEDCKGGDQHVHQSFHNKQAASDGAPELHSHAEHGKGNAAPSAQSSKQTFYDAATSAMPKPSEQSMKELLGRSPDSSEGSGGMDRYTTASESGDRDSMIASPKGKALSPAQMGKQKATALSSLDGMMDEEPNEQQNGAAGENEGKDEDQKSPQSPDIKPDGGIAAAVTNLLKGDDDDNKMADDNAESADAGIDTMEVPHAKHGLPSNHLGPDVPPGITGHEVEDNDGLKHIHPGAEPEDDEGDVVEQENAKSS